MARRHPDGQIAGTVFNVTVNAVDANWNLLTSVSDTVGITTSDANAGLPLNAALVGGSQTFSVILKTAGSATVTTSDITDAQQDGQYQFVDHCECGRLCQASVAGSGRDNRAGNGLQARPARQRLAPPARHSM
jgi:hypothetical protein